jgi:DNA integrity scanning protein DisA with diadenylate cyclase activity
MHDAELAEIDDAFIGLGHFLADLMSIDGALVLDGYFRLVGFGGEILGESHVAQIHRAFDLEAVASGPEAADSSGTRHRAAYRLVEGTREAIAVVVSQDGDAHFVAHHNGKLVYWPYIP